LRLHKSGLTVLKEIFTERADEGTYLFVPMLLAIDEFEKSFISTFCPKTVKHSKKISKSITLINQILKED
jgi:hypothetical protein